MAKKHGNDKKRQKASNRRQLIKQKRKDCIDLKPQSNDKKQVSIPPKLSSATKELSRQNLKLKRNQLKQAQLHKIRAGCTGSLESLTAKAQQDAENFANYQSKKDQNDQQHSLFNINDSSRKAYMKELRKVVQNADVILEVLDARDPMGCRSFDIEESIIARGGKKLVLVLNKIDLVPRDILPPWLSYLRRSYPTIAFKASTQDQSNNLAQTKGKADHELTDKLIQTSRSVGTDALMQLLKNYCRNSSMKTSITVGIIGYPNVGKSSLINSLKRNKSVGVSSTAGFTKVMQEIHLDKKIKLLDCPGIVFDENEDPRALFLRNCVNIDSLEDPIPAVEVLLSRGCTYNQLCKLYNIPVIEDVMLLLFHVAKRIGKLSKGGVPERKAAARYILQDWNKGKIPYYTAPPSSTSDSSMSKSSSSSENILESTVVTTFSEEFDIDKVLNPTSEIIEQSESMETAIPYTKEKEIAKEFQPKCSIVVDANHSMSDRYQMRKTNSDDDDTDMSDEDEDDLNESMNELPVPVKNAQQVPVFEEDLLNPQTAQIARKKAKKLRKERRRNARRLDSSIESMVCDDVASMSMKKFVEKDTTDMLDALEEL